MLARVFGHLCICQYLTLVVVVVLLGDPTATFARKVICELGELFLVFDELVAFMYLLVPLA